MSRELLKLASRYAMQLGWTAEEIGGLARDCFNEVASLAKTEAGQPELVRFAVRESDLLPGR